MPTAFKVAMNLTACQEGTPLVIWNEYTWFADNEFTLVTEGIR